MIFLIYKIFDKNENEEKMKVKYCIRNMKKK